MRYKRYYAADPACQKCEGTGFYQQSDPKCQHCEGAGEYAATGICQQCKGEGRLSPAEGADKVNKCPDCEGTGSVGLTRACSCVVGLRVCDCQKQQLLRDMIEEANIPSKYLASTVAAYVPETAKEKATKEYISRWIENYPKPLDKDGIFLYGAPGTGKTHLAAALCMALIKRNGVQPCYISMTALVRSIYRRINDKEMDDPTDDLMSARVLVVDDLGADKRPSEHVLEILSELFDYRYRNGKPMIITSNLDLGTLESIYANRIPDRIYETCQILHCDGRSRRRPKEEVA